MTPFEQHATLGHDMTRSSPDGVDMIDECDTCGMRWLHKPAIAYPITLRPTKEWYAWDSARRMVGQCYWLNRNCGPGKPGSWAMVCVIKALRHGLVTVRDEERGDYLCEPKNLIPEWRLTRKQRIACGIA